MVIKLKPCPFCGEEAYFQHYRGYWIECRQCDGSIGKTSDGGAFETAEEAAAAWNRRANEPA